MKNKILGYKIKRFKSSEIIPVDAVFMLKESGSTYLCGSYYSYEYFIYQIPIYKTVKAKRGNPPIK